MSEQPKQEEHESPYSEKIEGLQEQVAQVDKFLKDEDLSDADKADLLDEREGLRLQALADGLISSKLNPIPELDDEVTRYLRPSMRQELDELIEQTTDKQLADQLSTIKLVIDKAAAANLIHKVYAGNDGEGVQNSVDGITGIDQLP